MLDAPPRLGGTRLGVVDGPSGSGKTTFAQDWAAAVRSAGCESVAVFSSDLLATWDEPFGWWTAFDDGVLQPLSRGRPGRARLTDWTAGPPQPGDWLTIPVPDVLILEGVSCGRRALDGRASLLVWIELADRAARLDRAVGRDGERARAHLTTWQQDEDGFYAVDRTAERADLVVDVGTDEACCRT